MEGLVMGGRDWKTVRSAQLFCAMSDENFNRLMESAFLHRFPKNSNLVTEGDEADFLYVLLDGIVELFSCHGTHRTTLHIIRPIATFTLPAVFHEGTYLSSARALGASDILMIPAQTVRQMLRAATAFADSIVHELAERYCGTLKALKSVKLRDGIERLANWILRTNKYQGQRNHIELTFDNRTLASRLGMTPENLSRSFAILMKHGVRKEGRTIMIEDPSALMLIANPSSLIDG